MKIVVVGTRGIPDVQGGVETVCQELYPRLAAMGHDVTVICRSPYVEGRCMLEYKGVHLCNVYAPRRKSIEAIVHTFLAILKAKRLRPDVIHLHAVGPALLTPFARLLGLKVVMTNHGPDYDRKKWGRMAKTVLKMGERMGTRFANNIISISPVISDNLKRQYGRERGVHLIPNGVNAPARVEETDYVESLGLTSNQYVIGLGRLVGEKGFDDLIEAYRRLGLEPGFKLVIAGDADHEDDYSLRLKKLGAETPGVVMTGFVKGRPLHQLMTHAALFAMPSYHEGLPVALLEAMSYGLDVAVSDIPACRLPEIDDADRFAVGDVDALAALIRNKMKAPAPRRYDLSRYDWDRIALRTSQVIAQTCGKARQE